MLTSLTITSLYVLDQDQALVFYVGTLGLDGELQVDEDHAVHSGPPGTAAARPRVRRARNRRASSHRPTTTATTR